MDVDKEYIVIMLDITDTETYEYFTNKRKALKYAQQYRYAYKSIAVKEVDYVNDEEEIIWSA